MQKIEIVQIKKIYAIGSALGIVKQGNREDYLHILIGGITGKDSVKELSYQDASKVIIQLKQLQGKENAAKKQGFKKSVTPKQNTVSGGVTQGQQKKIWALMYELKKYDKAEGTALIGERLCGIIKKELKITCGLKNPFAWLDFTSGNKLIEILKKYIASAQKQGV